MEISTTLLIYVLIGFVIGMIIMRFINKNNSIGLLNDAKKQAEKIIESANEKGDNIKNNKIIQAKEKFLELKSEHEKIIFSREDKIKAIEREISSKESQVDSIIKKNQALNSDLEKRHLEVQDKINSLDNKTKEVEKVRKNQIKQLELISGLSEKEAKNSLLESLKKDAENERLAHKGPREGPFYKSPSSLRATAGRYESQGIYNAGCHGGGSQACG